MDRKIPKAALKNLFLITATAFRCITTTEYDASNTYGVRSIPQTVFINAEGSLYNTRVGAMSEVVLENYIKQMIGDQL